ncbi:hypothetical protein [Paraburkholderia unamae]|uniref:Nuclease-like protein n=1 Tax=Paraburkholderia unamae TaxID=219649 RepID=A0ABX5KL16_9BURK|nr:hypothetical protein [Paraburkholderia unamae]PVX82457.1 hypothetical protein C7402_109311 [Paraburkholderia unamae]
MDFLLAYRHRDLPSPLNLQRFSEETWTRDFERLGTDDADADLYRAGLMVHEKCLRLWSMRYLPESGLNDVTKIRAALAVGNHAARAIIHRMKTLLAGAQGNGKPAVPLNQLNIKIEAPGGAFSPDELIQATEVGVRLSIGETLRSVGSGPDGLTGNASFKKVDWDRLLVEFNLGAQFDDLSEQWDDFAWNGYRIEEKRDATLIVPRDDDWIVRNRVSGRRLDNLLLQYHHNSIENLKLWPDHALFAAAPRSVKRISRRDGNYVIDILNDHSSNRDDAIRWLASASYAQEPYYEELLSRPRPLLSGGTIYNLMSAWAVLQSISLKLFDFESDTTDDREPHAWVAQYLPVIDVATIARAISVAARVAMSRATSIVKFLTYSGAYHQELYGHPLVPVSRTAVSPCLAGIYSPNIHRLTDVWLRELGEQLEQRGPVFERFIRAHVAESAAESPTLSESASVLPEALNFTVPGRRPEEIDLVVVIENLVLVGEVKCMLQPTESQETARHRQKVELAANQIARKAAFVRDNATAFREQLAARGVQCPEGFEVLPLVVLNNPIHVGFPVEDVPIVDEHILKVFFDGALENAVVLTETGEDKLVRSLPLYSGLEGLAENAKSYFSSPPQLDFLKRSVKHRLMPVLSISDDDRPWFYITVECAPHLDAAIWDQPVSPLTDENKA